MKHRIFRCCKRKLGQSQQSLILPLVITIAAICCLVPAYGYADVNVRSKPVLVSGSPLEKGAVYRLPKVVGNVDALLTIYSVVNATVLKVDYFASVFDSEFHAQIETHAADAHVEFEISLVSIPDHHTVESPIDISVIKENSSNTFDQITPISRFVVESGSVLAVSSPEPQTLVLRDLWGASLTQDTSERFTAATVKLDSGETLFYRVGSDLPAHRSATVKFSAIEFVEPIVRRVDQLPNARDDIAVVDFNSALLVAAPGLLSNDGESNSASAEKSLTIEHFKVADNSASADATIALPEGHITVNSNGAYQFLPAPDFNGSIPDIRYVVRDADVGRDDAYLRLSINRDSLLPIAKDDIAQLSRMAQSHGNISTIDVLKNDTDPDGFLNRESLVLLAGDIDTAAISSLPRSAKTLFVEGEGHWSVKGDGTVSFQPLANSSGNVSPLTYGVADDDGHFTSARIVLRDDELALQLAVTIDEDVNNDGWINNAELRGQIDISLYVPDTAVAGDRITVSANGTDLDAEITTEVIADGKLVVALPQPGDGSTFTVVGNYFDGNGALVATASDSAVVDLLPTGAPVVTVVADADNGGFLSLQEYTDESQIRIELPAGAVVNDRVEARIGTTVVDMFLSPLDIADGQLMLPVTMPAEGSTLSVLIRIFDEAGNSSDIASDSVVIDTIAPVPPSVDPLVTASSTPLVTGELPETGDFIFSVEVNGVVYANGDGNLSETGAGGWQLLIPVLDQLPNGTYDVEAVLIDMAGNRSVDTTANELRVDLVLPELTSPNIGPVSDPAPLISGTTDQNDSGVVTVLTTGGVFVCNAVVETGNWSCRSRVLLPPGESELIASIADQVGNVARSQLTITVAESSDQDEDGIPDDIEGAVDTDGDGVPNFLDLDSDNDTIVDAVETAIDTDGDQIRDFLDLDSDNDTLSDLLEGGFSKLVDKDQNGSVDRSIVLGNNGLADVIEVEKDSGHTRMPVDTDNDGLADYIDLDSDSDGLSDKIEQGIRRSQNGENPASLNAALNDDQPISVLHSAVDSDRDGVPDYLDLDSDQDGVSDVLEGYGIDADHDGRLDNTVDDNKDGISEAVDTVADLDPDQDGLFNHQDLDSDADTLSDLIESGGVDANADGIHDSWLDKNQNGIYDDVDVAFSGGEDTDKDMIDDLYDVDFKEESDADSDGIIDSKDVDSDGNGRLDLLDDQLLEVTDTDGDGVADMFQPSVVNTISTGTGAFGCSLSTTSRAQAPDPTFLFILAWLFAAALYRRRHQRKVV